MATFSILRVKGLATADNQLSAVPEGGLVTGDNIVTPHKDVVEPRRGQKWLGYTFGLFSDRSNEGVFWGDTLFLQYGSATLCRDTGSAFVDVSGSYTPPDPTVLRMKFMEAAQNLYFTASSGVYVLDTAAGTPAAAGVPAPLHFGSVALVSTSGWVPLNCQVAYRVVIGTKDANGNVKLGPPSGRLVLASPVGAFVAAAGELIRTDHPTIVGTDVITVTHVNHGVSKYYQGILTVSPGEALLAAGVYTSPTVTGADVLSFLVPDDVNGPSLAGQTLTPTTSSPSFQFHLPSGVTTSHFYRVYRSYTSVTADTEPDDELYLVREAQISGADIAAGYIQVVDKTPESMLGAGAPLYTNPNTGDGIDAAHEGPPLAKDILSWRNRAFYFNTTDRHRLMIHVLGCGSPDGIQNADTITIGGVTYTAATAGSSGNLFALYVGFDPASNIELTAQALVDRVNSNKGSTGVVARYVDVENEPPGAIELSGTALGAPSFSVYASRTASWFPTLTTGLLGAVTSTAERRKNGFSWSQLGEPEAVPLLNFDLIGRQGTEIVRAVASRDRIFVFLDDSTIHAISGTGPFRVDPLDDTAQLLGPDTAVTHNGQILAFTTQGVVSVSDSGVRILSAPIEDQLLALIGSCLPQIKRYSFGVSYESDRQFQLWLPSSSSDTSCTQAFVYNSLHNTWVRWSGSRTWGRVRKSTNTLYLGDGAANKVRLERKDYARTDFADEELPVTIISHSGTTAVLNSVSGITVGDLLYQSDSIRSVITAVDVGTTTVTLATREGWSDATALIKVAFTSTAIWCPAAPAGPSVYKQFRQIALHFKKFFTNTFSVIVDSDRAPTSQTVTISAPGFGLVPFGTGPFGQRMGIQNQSIGVHPDQQRASQLHVGFSVREAWSIWSLNGYSLQYEVVTERGGS